MLDPRTLEFTRHLVRALENKKGEDILVLDISHLTPIAESFVLCSGPTDRVLETLRDAALDAAEEAGWPARVEGEPTSGWVLIDFGDVILHLFTPEVRRYYDLEGLWAKARVVVRMP